MDHGILWPDEHGEELARELKRGGAHKPRGFLAHPDKQVGVGVQDVDILGEKELLLQLVARHLHLPQHLRILIVFYQVVIHIKFLNVMDTSIGYTTGTNHIFSVADP